MDVLDGVPRHVLGHPVKTRIQIILYYLIPACLELQAYIIQTVADTAVTVQHFRDRRPLCGWLTLAFLCLPAFICFLSIMISPHQWPTTGTYCNSENFQFFAKQLFNFLLFPIGALYRFGRRIFWSMDSLFYDKDYERRQHSVMKAAETSPFELYHFMQAYAQAAPQAILQLFVILRVGIFQNYETTRVQVLSIIFSLINISVITMSYQRFESQKIVGRNYPWATLHQIQHHRKKFNRTRSYVEAVEQNRNNDMKKINNYPENEKILERFHSQVMESENSETLTGSEMKIFRDDEKETKAGGDGKDRILAEHTDDGLVCLNVTDDEKLCTCQKYQTRHEQEREQKQRKCHDELDAGGGRRHEELKNLDAIEIVEEISLNSTPLAEHKRIGNVENMDFDSVPDFPAPLPPLQSHAVSVPDSVDRKQQNYFNALNRLSAFKDILILKAEICVKEHIPRPPRALVQHATKSEEWKSNWKMEVKSDDYHHDSDNGNIKMSALRDNENHSHDVNKKSVGDEAERTLLQQDETDFIFPTKKQLLRGVEQDDFAAKSVSFFGWILFIFMRIISLSVFSVFYPKEFLYMVLAHYGVILACLIYETKFQVKIQRTIFYLFLAYIYIFVILEFRIKFKHLRLWYVGYFVLVMMENFTSTLVWYFGAEFESWWFDYLFQAIIVSGIYNVACMFVYYFILRPKDVILVET